MGWIVEVEDRKDWNIRHTIRICSNPECNDKRYVTPNGLLDVYCPMCGQMMNQPKEENDNGRDTTG